jgi:sigma-B regulation protein RsbU (phosphoserine phosphatase)
MRLRAQLSLAFLLLAVLPLTAVTLFAYRASRQAFRSAVEAEGRRLAYDMSGRVAQALEELSAHVARMRERPRQPSASAFEQARNDAIAAAQQEELRSLLGLILSEARRQEGGVPFVIDAEQRLYASSPADLGLLYGLGVAPAPAGAKAAATDRDAWVVVSERHAASGITVGVAQPLDQALREIRHTAARNLGYGLAVVALALLGIVPLSRALTRPLAALTEGAQRLSRGDLEVQVAVPRGAELGRLAATFNRMATDLRRNQERLLEQERLHKELEISRRIQEELLPREPGRFAFAEAAGTSIPAREVGGDFFNYFLLSGGEAAVLVGDVSGKGVPAAILMANLQATLRARLAHEKDLALLAERLDHELGGEEAATSYLTLFLAVVDGRSGWLRYVNAGHVTPLLVRRGGGIERLESTGRPLGLLPGGGYQERRLEVGRGDVLFLFTDGLVDAENAGGQAFGAERVEQLLTSGSDGNAADLLARVEQALLRHRGASEASDDATIVALRLLEEGVRS